MPVADDVLEQAVQYLTRTTQTPPNTAAVVAALLEAEKHARQTKTRYTYAQVMGTWQLGLITGTTRSRKKAGMLLGPGRFLPSWITIQIAFGPSASSDAQGTVENSVQLAAVKLSLSGPTRFWEGTNILAFDFTRMAVSASRLTLYQGNIRGGDDADAKFYQQPLKEQAFFNYFWVTDRAIAARGRGGGLALWTRAEAR